MSWMPPKALERLNLTFDAASQKRIHLRRCLLHSSKVLQNGVVREWRGKRHVFKILAILSRTSASLKGLVM